MKLLFASDIHGSKSAAGNVLKAFENENADYLVLCGDLLYHGPRNDLPDEYNPKAVIEILNSVSSKIIAVRGNCDSEVDQMVLDFPMMADYSLIADGNVKMYVTHGHIFSPENPLKLSDGEIMIGGHTHVLAAEKCSGFYYLNPGSCAIPKNSNPPTYMVYENGSFAIKEFNGGIVTEFDAESEEM